MLAYKWLASRALAALTVLAGVVTGRAQALDVSLTPSVASPSPVGTIVTWTAAASGSSGNLWYRFRARPAGMDFRMVRDFSATETLEWTASQHEGIYEIEATARDT